MPPTTEELPLTGEGVERKAIAAIDKAYRAWNSVKDKRIAIQNEEKPLKAALLSAFHNNEDKLPKDKDDGALLYRTSDDKILRLKGGKETLTIEDVEDEE